MPQSPITREKCPAEQKSEFLPRYVGTGRYLLLYEAYVYALMESYTDTYAGGIWEFFSLSNGGFFISLADEVV